MVNSMLRNAPKIIYFPQHILREMTNAFFWQGTIYSWKIYQRISRWKM